MKGHGCVVTIDAHHHMSLEAFWCARDDALTRGRRALRSPATRIRSRRRRDIILAVARELVIVLIALAARIPSYALASADCGRRRISMPLARGFPRSRERRLDITTGQALSGPVPSDAGNETPPPRLAAFLQRVDVLMREVRTESICTYPTKLEGGWIHVAPDLPARPNR